MKKKEPKKQYPPLVGWRTYQAARRKAHDELGLCRYCKLPAVAGLRMCAYHRDYQRETRELRQKERLCHDCANRAVKGLSRCQYHREVEAERSATERRVAKRGEAYRLPRWKREAKA